MFEFKFPSYFIRDPEIIKKLCVKEFDSFSDHRALIPVDADPIFGRSLFFMHGQDWRGKIYCAIIFSNKEKEEGAL